MQTISGQVVRFLQDPDGEVHGLVLDGGEEVRFPAGQGHLVTLIVCIGSHVGIEGTLRPDDSADGYWEGRLITNFDSKRSVTFLASNCQDKPGMLLETTPSSIASLVPSNNHGGEEAQGQKTLGETEIDLQDPSLEGLGSQPKAQPSSPFAYESKLRNSLRPQNAVQNEAAAGIGKAYDRLHRLQAILAYLHIMKRQVAGIGQFLDEAKHTYEQALSRYEARTFAAASEFAAASASLSRVVEIIMGRTLRSDTSFPSLVPPPPEHFSPSMDSIHVEENLAEAESVLSRIQWLLQNGTLPLEDRTQVRKIASWGDALYKQAMHMYRQAAIRDAFELAEAALIGAHSAEHICRKRYVGQAAHAQERVSEELCPH